MIGQMSQWEGVRVLFWQCDSLKLHVTAVEEMLREKNPECERRPAVTQVIQEVQILNDGELPDELRAGEVRRLAGRFWKTPANPHFSQ